MHLGGRKLEPLDIMSQSYRHWILQLMPDNVRAVLYWIDDVTLAESINRSGSAALLERSSGANEHYQHLLPHDAAGKAKSQPPPPYRIQPDAHQGINSSYRGVP
jgi:hypothetical protein